MPYLRGGWKGPRIRLSAKSKDEKKIIYIYTKILAFEKPLGRRCAVPVIININVHTRIVQSYRIANPTVFFFLIIKQLLFAMFN